MARREVTGRGPGITDPIDQPGPESDESDDDESDEPAKRSGPAPQALVTRPPVRGPPWRLARKAAGAHPQEAVTYESDAYSVEEFCRRHRISVQLFYKFENDMPNTFSVGKRRLISREAAARWRAEREAVDAKREAVDA
jgi:hypothetical protein